MTIADLASSLGLLLAVLVLAGFFSASETAIFSLRRADRARIEAERSPRARAALDLLARPRTLLVAILLIGVSLDALFFSVSAGIAHDLAELHGTWVIPAVGALSVLTVLLLAEIVPKAIAAHAPAETALLAARTLRLVRDALRVVTVPLETALARVVDLIERPLPRATPGLADSELVRFVEHEGAEGRLERRASELLADVLELRSRRVKEVMVPRVDVRAFDLRSGKDAFLELVRATRHQKFPVHDGRGLDRVHGFLRGRSVLAAPPGVELARLVEPAWFVPETKSLESLLREMVEKGRTVAVVVDEHGGTAGLVGLEDVIEEIVGDIASPLDRPLVRTTGDGRWLLAGRLGLREAGEILGVRFPALGSTTLSGFLATELGRVPETGDEVSFLGVKLRVESVVRGRVKEVAAARAPVVAEAAAS